MDDKKEIEEMKAKCKKREAFWSIVSFICCLLLSTQILNRLRPFARVSEHYVSMLQGVQFGFIIGLAGVSLFFIIYYSRGINNDTIARKIYIKENDERNKAIKEKAGVKFYIINAVSLAIAIVISGYFNHIIFFTLIGVLYFQIFIMIVFKIYWRKKL